MGKSYVVKYFKRISETAYEPLAHSIYTLQLELDHYPELFWCYDCNAAVDAEGYITAQGISEPICPFCGTELGSQYHTN